MEWRTSDCRVLGDETPGRGLRLGLLVAGLLALAVGLASPAWAASRFVATSGTDSGNTCISPGSPCKTITHSLSQAVANDTISVAAGTYTAPGEIFPLTINKNLTLTGGGAPTTVIDATGAGTNVITVSGEVTAAISGVTITGGSVSCPGPCGAQGGGLFNSSGATLILTNVTVSGNTVTCVNTGDNPCVALRGGLTNSSGATLTLRAIIIALQLAGADCFNSGTITSTGFNLDSDNTCNLTGTGDKPGVINPLLGPLANNGGPTQTHALLPGSPALNMVLSGCPPPATDQRGITRPQGTDCDIGAYELEVKAPIPTLSEWGMIGMLGLLLLGGLGALRRHVRPGLPRQPA